MADGVDEADQEVTHYSVMGLPEDVTDADIRLRYLELADAVRPTGEIEDRSLLLTLNEAYQTLKEPDLRRAYDEKLARDRAWRTRDAEARQRRAEGLSAFEASHAAWAERQAENRQERAEHEARRAEIDRLAAERRAEAELAEEAKRLSLLDEARAVTPMNTLEKLQLYGMIGLFVGWLTFAAVAAQFRDAPDDALSGLETTAALLVAVLAFPVPYLITKAAGALFRTFIDLVSGR